MSLKDATQCQRDKQYDVNMGALSSRFTCITTEADIIGWQNLANETGDKDVIVAVRELRAMLIQTRDLVRLKMRVRP